MGIVRTDREERKFESGAKRDNAEDKGRADLLPLIECGKFLGNNLILQHIGNFVMYGDEKDIYLAIERFTAECLWTKPGTLLELSHHYQEGAKRYDERNWEKGIPLHSFIDSGVRHYLKHINGMTDERHDRAFIWNMFGALWTLHNKPELNDLPCREVKRPR